MMIPSGILQFLPSFNLGNNIPSTYTDTKKLHKYENLFSRKLTIKSQIGSPSTTPERLSPPPHPLPSPLSISPGRRSSQSGKFESKQNWKIPIAHSLLWAEKNESSTRATFTNPSFQSCCVRKNFKVQPKIHI